MPGKKDEKVKYLERCVTLIGPVGGSDPLGLSKSHPCDQQNLSTLTRDVRLTLGADCLKDSKTATSVHDFLENLKRQSPATPASSTPNYDCN